MMHAFLKLGMTPPPQNAYSRGPSRFLSSASPYFRHSGKMALGDLAEVVLEKLAVDDGTCPVSLQVSAHHHSLLVTPVIVRGATTYDIRKSRERRTDFKPPVNGFNLPSVRMAATIVLQSEVVTQQKQTGKHIRLRYCRSDNVTCVWLGFPFELSPKDEKLRERLEDALSTAALMRPLAGTLG